MGAPSDEPAGKAANRKLRTFDDDDIVRFSLGMEVPVVGLVRDRGEYKEMREIALIYGATLGLEAPRPEAPEAQDAPEEPTHAGVHLHESGKPPASRGNKHAPRPVAADAAE